LKDKLDEIEDKFDALDKFTQILHPTFEDRHWGIASLHLYAHRKTKFMYDILAKIPQDPAPNVCELGFMAGHSATLFLETLPTAIMYSFDLDDNPWSPTNLKHIVETYGAHRFHHYAGDSLQTIPKMATLHPNVRCDVLMIDGSKNGPHRYLDMMLFKKIAAPNAILFLDEVNTYDCVTAKAKYDDCNLGDYAQLSLVYNDLSRAGLLEVGDCITTKTPYDGYCVAKYGPSDVKLSKYEQ